MTGSLTVDQADTLGADLIRALSAHIGNEGAIETELQRWVAHLGCAGLSQVLLAAVVRVFGECLSVPDQFPPDGIRFEAEEAA